MMCVRASAWKSRSSSCCALWPAGELWERFSGACGGHGPRLTTYFILMLMVFAYFILRNAVERPRAPATCNSAVLGILICVDVPICFMVTRIIPSGVHRLFSAPIRACRPTCCLPFLLSLFGMMLIAFGLYRLRLRTQIMQRQSRPPFRRIGGLNESRSF